MTKDSTDTVIGANPGSSWRGALFFVPLFAWALIGAGMIGVMAMLSEHYAKTGWISSVRLWGRFPLMLIGVKLDVHGIEHRDSPGSKLILFNHVSLLDLFVLSALCPERAIVLYKIEFERIPGIAIAFTKLGMIPVDRTNLESAVTSIMQAGRRIQSEGGTCVIAPEGTRSRNGGLQRFKLGAFHLAAEHSIPIVPMVMRGLDQILPMGKLIARSGTIRIDFLPAIETSDWSTEDSRQHSQEVRDLFLEYLPAEKKPKRKPKKDA
ncbi:MAG: putative phosphoserine phosphatase/1-acylglycerol-3-phosphate O-acyltransferase [Planctomycetota bacterium]|jgi:putative phosphoserine phosphatase/1-acylglycerol-3-phosphate O-acyltransferase